MGPSVGQLCKKSVSNVKYLTLPQKQIKKTCSKEWKWNYWKYWSSHDSEHKGGKSILLRGLTAVLTSPVHRQTQKDKGIKTEFRNFNCHDKVREFQSMLVVKWTQNVIYHSFHSRSKIVRPKWPRYVHVAVLKKTSRPAVLPTDWYTHALTVHKGKPDLFGSRMCLRCSLHNMDQV